MGLGMWSGLEKATSTVLNTGADLMKQDAIERHQKVVEGQNNARLKMEQDEYDKKQQMYNRPIDITTTPEYLSMPDDVKPKVLQYFSENGYTDQNGRGKAGDVMGGLEVIGKTKPLFTQFMEPVIKARQQGVVQAWNEYQDARASGDEKKTQIAMAKYQKLQMEYQASSGNFDQHLKAIDEAELKRELADKKKNEPREVNVANDIDSVLGGMFPGYYNNSDVRQKALDYYATPQGYQKVQNEVIRIAREKQPIQYAPVQTTTGIEPFQTRGPGAGKVPAGGSPAKPMPAEAIKQMSDLHGLKETALNAKKLFKHSYVGPVAGRVAGVKEQLVNLPEDQVQFYAYVNDAKDALLRARSGAQINEQEYARLVKFLPTSELPEENFKARLNRFVDQVDLLMREKKKMYETQGYKVELPSAKRQAGRFIIEEE